MVKFGIFIPVNSQYFISLQGLLYSFKTLVNLTYKIHIIDMGLHANQINWIKKNFGSGINHLFIQFDKINISHQDIKNYRFKIKTIQHMLNFDYDICMMFDSKNHLKIPLSEMNNILDRVLINEVKFIEKDWTHDTCLETMEASEDIRNSFQYQSNNPVFRMAECKDIINDIIKYGMDDRCLCPKGSEKSMEGPSRHRQDQSVISITLKKHGIKPHIIEYTTYHNTIAIL